jgi:LmbE family N-acetylglucosaminyl deacetylase
MLGARRTDRPAAKTRVVVAGGHPGDPEYGCGGTIARLAEAGHDVALLYLNDGERAGRPKTGHRIAEATRACEGLRARPLFAGQVDGAAVVDNDHQETFRKLLEAERPDAVFTHWPIDNHADHRAITALVYAAFLKLGRPFALFYYEVSTGEDTEQFAPTSYVDISEFEPRKRSACFAHASQAPERFYALQDQVALMRGIERGCRRAEGFIRHVRGPVFGLP